MPVPGGVSHGQAGLATRQPLGNGNVERRALSTSQWVGHERGVTEDLYVARGEKAKGGVPPIGIGSEFEGAWEVLGPDKAPHCKGVGPVPQFQWEDDNYSGGGGAAGGAGGGNGHGDGTVA